MRLTVSKFSFLKILVLSIIFGFLFTFPIPERSDNFFVKRAEAVRGRPASPGSAAGAHRRHRRRTIRRHNRVVVGTRVTVLPTSYRTVVVHGTTYYYYEEVYYQPYYEGNTVVYVVVEDPNR